MSKRRENLDKIWLVLLALTPIVLWILPADFFDHGDVILCPSRLFFNIECFGCGMTRAIQHFHHFEFQEAFYYNYGSILVYPGLVFVWFLWVFKALNRLNINPLKRSSKS